MDRTHIGPTWPLSQLAYEFESFGDRAMREDHSPMTDDSAWLGFQRLPEVTVHASGALAQTIRAELRQTRRVRTDVQVAVCIMTRVRETPLWREVEAAVPEHGLGVEGFVVVRRGNDLVVAAEGGHGLLYGYFYLLRYFEWMTGDLTVVEQPAVPGIAVSLSVEFTDDPTDERVARWWSATNLPRATSMPSAGWHGNRPRIRSVCCTSGPAPLGVGFMVTPQTHYGPSVNGYEYSGRGTTTSPIGTASAWTGP
jgi:alpha-glucuronidase